MTPNPRLQRTRSATPPSPLSRQPLGARVIRAAVVAGFTFAYSQSALSETEAASQRAVAPSRSLQVVATVQDRDDDTHRFLQGMDVGGKDFDAGGNRLLVLRVEWASEEIGDPMLVAVEPEDGGVACGETRTAEGAAEKSRYFDLKVGDRLLTTITLVDDRVCGRLRPCDSKLDQIWLMDDWRKIDERRPKK